MKPLISHVKKYEEKFKEMERIYQEYNDGGPYSMLELVEIRKEIEGQINYFTVIAHDSIEGIYPYEIYFESEFYQKKREESVKELKEYFNEDEDIFRMRDWFLDHTCSVLQDRFDNKLSDEQIKSARFILDGLVTYSQTIFDFEIRKQALNRYIKNALRNQVKRDDKHKPNIKLDNVIKPDIGKGRPGRPIDKEAADQELIESEVMKLIKKGGKYISKTGKVKPTTIRDELSEKGLFNLSDRGLFDRVEKAIKKMQ